MSAQLEDGFTRIANTILEQLATSAFNGTQFNIILAILRNTYGFQRKSHSMSLTFLSAATKRKKEQIKKELDKLIGMKVLTVNGGSFTESRELGINKNFSEWQIDYSAPKRAHPPKESTPQLEHTQYPNPTTGGVLQLEHQERNGFKENLKEKSSIEDPFIFLLNEFCKIHSKAEYHVTPIEKAAMHEVLRVVPVEFAVEDMKRQYERKAAEGGKIKSFNYYPESLIQGWQAISRAQQEVSAGAEPPPSNVKQFPRNKGGFSRKPQVPIVQPEQSTSAPSPERVAELLALAKKMSGKGENHG